MRRASEVAKYVTKAADYLTEDADGWSADPDTIEALHLALNGAQGRSRTAGRLMLRLARCFQADLDGAEHGGTLVRSGLNSPGSHLDSVTSAVATTGITAPVWMTWLDGASKVIALVYSLLRVVWLIKQIARSGRSSEKMSAMLLTSFGTLKDHEARLCGVERCAQ